MSLHQLLLQFSALSIVIKQEEETTVYDQLSNFYDILNSPLNWTWPVDLIRAVKDTDQRPGLFCMTVTFSRRPSAIGIGYRTWCNISFDGVHIIYDNYVPTVIDLQPEPEEEEGLKVRQCYSCKMCCPDFYPDITPAILCKSKESVILIHVKMEDKITNLKIEIAECLDILMFLVCRRFSFTRPENPIKNVIFTKSLCLNKTTKKAKVTFDGALEFEAPQCTSLGNHENVSLFCMCKKF